MFHKFRTGYAAIGLKLIGAIAAAELLIMMTFNLIHIERSIPPLLINLIDTLILSVAASVMIFYWVVKPMKSVEEFKKVEKDLRESEEQYRLLFESNPHPMWVYDIETLSFLAVNDAAVIQYGYSREEFFSMTIKDIRPPEDIPALLENISRITEGLDKAGIWRHRKKDGAIIYVEITSHTMTFAGKHAEIVLVNDVTERKKAEEKLIETTQALQSLIKASPLAIIVVDPGGHVLIWNPAAENIFGWSEQEVTGRLNPIIPEDKLEEFRAFLERVLRGESFSNVETRRLKKDGSLIDVSLSTAPLMDVKGSVIGILGLLTDITKRKRMEEEIFQISREWEETFNSITDMVTVHDKDWNIIRANKSAEKILGLPFMQTTEDRKCFKYYHGTEKPPEGCPSCNCLTSGTSATFELFEPHLNMFIEIRAIPMFDSNNNLIGLIHVVRDVTERKKAEEEKHKLEEQLRQAQKMEAIGQLAGGVAHDFNNILSAIIGYGSLLQMKMGADDPLRVNAEQILESAERAATLTHSLLAFSRKQIMNPKLVNLNEIIKGVERFLMRLIGEDIQLKTVLTAEPLIALADTGQMEQVLMNLATNARDAMPKGGRLTISSDLIELDEGFIKAHGYGAPGIYALISMTDTGIGMDEKTREKIFEPFFTTKEVDKGTGLGLAMVYGIIKQHNGFINVYSESGKGTTFKIYLPVIKAKVEEVKEAVSAAPLQGGTETILAAEDDAALRKLTRTVLEAYGYKVIIAEDGEDAVRKFMDNKDKIKLCVLDMIMPKKSGREAYDEIKKIRPDIKVLFASGYTADKIHKEGILEEGMEFILKPIFPKDLLRKVREILDRR